MQRFKSTLQLPFEHKKLEKLMEITGIALAPGVYTGIDGKTVDYSEEVIRQVINTAIGKTILYAHSKDEEDGEDLKYISVGFFGEAWPENKAAAYKGILYNPLVFPLVEDKTLHSGSLELDVQAEYNSGREMFEARQVTTEAMTLTDRPAFKGAEVRSHEYVTQVKLEAWPGEPDRKVGATNRKRKMSGNEDIDLEKLAEAGYPKPEQTPWGDLSDKEKYQTCAAFFKGKGYGMPAKQEDIDKLEQGYKDQLTALASAAGVDLSEYTDFIKSCMKDGKTMTACAAEWKKKGKGAEGAEESKEKWEEQLEQANKRIAHFEKQDINRLIAEIKAIDSKFDAKKFLGALEAFDQKRAMLEQYKSFLETHKPKVKLGLGEGGEDMKAKLEARRNKVIDGMDLSEDLLALLRPESD